MMMASDFFMINPGIVTSKEPAPQLALAALVGRAGSTTGGKLNRRSPQWHPCLLRCLPITLKREADGESCFSAPLADPIVKTSQTIFAKRTVTGSASL